MFTFVSIRNWVWSSREHSLSSTEPWPWMKSMARYSALFLHSALWTLAHSHTHTHTHSFHPCAALSLSHTTPTRPAQLSGLSWGSVSRPRTHGTRTGENRRTSIQWTTHSTFWDTHIVGGVSRSDNDSFSPVVLAPEPVDPRCDGDRRVPGWHQEAHATLHCEFNPRVWEHAKNNTTQTSYSRLTTSHESTELNS